MNNEDVKSLFQVEEKGKWTSLANLDENSLEKIEIFTSQFSSALCWLLNGFDN